MRKISIALSTVLPLSILRAGSGTNPLIVNYHVVSDEKLLHIDSLYQYRNKETFINDLDFYISNYNPISLQEFLNHLDGQYQLPKNSILLTFDDGLKEVNNIIPMLIDKKITATIFLTKNFIDNKELSWDHKKSLIINRIQSDIRTSTVQLIESELDKQINTKHELIDLILFLPYRKRQILDNIAAILEIDFDAFLKIQRPYLTSAEISEFITKGFSIGGHSIDHPPFRELSLNEQIEQTMESVNYVYNKFSLGYKVFAFPYTDIGITNSFFHKIVKDIDASFGTQGVLKDSIKNNFQRVSIESFNHSARKTVKFHYLRNIAYKLTLKNHLIRGE